MGFAKKHLKKIDQKIRHINHQRIDLFRKYRLIFFKALFNQKNTFLNSQPPALHKKILILRLDGKLGDTVTMTGFLAELLHQGYAVDILTRESNAFIYNYIPLKFNLIALKKSFFSFWLQFFKLKQHSYTALVCTTHIIDPGSLFISRFFKAEKKIIFLNEDLKFFDCCVKDQFFSKHVTHRYSQVLQFLDLRSDENKLKNYQLLVSESALSKVQFLLTDLKLKFKKVIVLNSFAGAKNRNLGYDKTLELVKAFAKKNIAVISLGNQGDLNLIRDWQKQNTISSWFCFGEGHLNFNLALMQITDLVISPDTSVVHMCCSLKKDLLALYRSDQNIDLQFEQNSVIWAPVNCTHEIILVKSSRISDVKTELIIEKACKMLKI